MTGNINGGDGNDTFNLNAVLTGNLDSGAGTNTFNSNKTVSGIVTVSGTDDWNYTQGVRLGTTVDGTGKLTVDNPASGNDITISNTDLDLSTLTGFTGDLVIGGTTNAVPITNATSITVNTQAINVDTAFTTAGSITLLAGDINLNESITTGITNTTNTIALIAVGPNFVPAVPGTPTGDINGPAAPSKTLTANNAILIASNTIQNSTNIELKLGNPAGSGEVDIATGSGDDLEFAGSSQFTDTTTSIDNLIATALSALGLNVTQAFSINPASALIGLETLAFIDVGLFEEELTLFGQIGTGIALSLAQCEEQEGCAPNVSENELNNLIEQLEARLSELERRLAEEAEPNVRATLEELIDGYNKELKGFREYHQQLQKFFSTDEEAEDLGEEGLPEEGGIPEEADAGEVARLAQVLETIKKRIEWLESLKGNPEERARLSESTGIDLTLETLETIIEAAKSEAAFIENRIRLLIEGTQAGLNPSSVFTAEARDYSSMQTLHYGENLLKLSDIQTPYNVY